MPDETRDAEATDGIDRRTVLRGATAAGIAGVGAVGTASAEEWKRLRFKSAGDETFRYRVSVSGELKREANRDGYDTLVDDNTAEGAASGGGYDDWLFTGDITELDLEGPGMVLKEGEVVEDTTEDEKLTNTVTLEADERVSYKFRVSGRVEKGPKAGTLGVDSIEDNVVRGKVGGSIEGNSDPVDDYRYSGSITVEEASGPLTVTLDIDGS
ncbi:hypothetical protein M0R89_14825 [Halorussus limi]|uniref:Uncharacterized protein n=1 Tax=Halorussus limi TaxID=2938695 RepID=A0A8U0HSY6_9EURY|nr:hypothetical protein [Halorussus limi]UPV73806.1 hypothetical protein M0R89_14825 [Halorussus limi]